MDESEPDPRLLVVWHSRTGASEQMAQQAADAASQEIAVDCKMAAQVAAEDLIHATAYLFVCPENLGSMSGGMKEFFDVHYYPVLGRIEGRPYATIIAAGSDGAGAQKQLDRIVTGWRLKRVTVISQCRELGAALGAGASIGLF